MSLSEQINDALASAPPAIMVGLTVRREPLRTRSREALAIIIARHLDGAPQPDSRQFGLPL